MTGAGEESTEQEEDREEYEGKCDGVCNTRNSHCIQACPPDTQGNMEYLCMKNKYHKVIDTCRTLNIFTIFENSHSLQQFGESMNIDQYSGKEETITEMLMQKCPEDLACVINGIRHSPRIPGNIAMIVELLHNISTELKSHVNEAKMQSYSIMANHILNSRSISNWTFIPEKNSSGVLLHSINSFARKLSIKKDPINISDTFIHIKGTILSGGNTENNFTFSMRVNDTGHKVTGNVFIAKDELWKPTSSSPVVSIAFPTLGAILEASLLENTANVNGLVLSIILPKELRNISLTFEKINKSEEKRTHCVGWHSLENRWDQEVCQKVQESAEQVVCKCKPHRFFTSFSILMSPHGVESQILTYITYTGLGISICSLILCLFIEALVWSQVTKTEISYLRHLCIVNVAVTLLMADVWFIAGSFLGGPTAHHNGCVAATFFVHFFYLSVFFWMLAKALLILYGILIVFHTLPKSVLVASLFLVGYGGPLVIAVITVAVTEPGQGYLRPEVCWLNWDKTKALLAFVVPALIIVVVNLTTVALVIVKTQQVTSGSSMFQEVRAIVRICKNIAILTPLLGLTWGFGIAIVINDSSVVFHIIFSLLNAFQGFFILVFGTILDPKIREALKCRVTPAKWISRLSEVSGPQVVIFCCADLLTPASDCQVRAQVMAAACTTEQNASCSIVCCGLDFWSLWDCHWLNFGTFHLISLVIPPKDRANKLDYTPNLGGACKARRFLEAT
ncbi:PREDICTED: probable G-protein coupled receptor 111 [Elephantulus edwardii]|uniref:probable G-protein coupled receptor 111 n=1 Tax=Elephantulus edwardii TaxID=28737 RepID=UPI0003F0992D|nr:PREDICTED: probable G-protein coupled receptor 111 [Elephantulus edwardii]